VAPSGVAGDAVGIDVSGDLGLVLTAGEADAMDAPR
jgi:hypothetical protein